MDSNDAVSLRYYMETTLEQYEKSHEKEHQLLAQNVAATKENLEFRLESMNQFREQIADERGSLVTIEKFEVLMKGIEKLVETHYQSNQTRINILEKSLSNLSGKWAGITAAFGVALILLELLLRFLVK